MKIKIIDETHVNEIQNLCFNCSDYFLMEQGKIANSDEGINILKAIPPNKTLEEKYVYGLFNETENLVGLMDINKDYPEKNTWMLGLLLIDPAERRKGLGRDFHEEIKAIVKAEKGSKIRIGVLEENKSVIIFWNNLGYKFINKSRLERDSGSKDLYILEYSVEEPDN